jgi:hypothetical protein
MAHEVGDFCHTRRATARRFGRHDGTIERRARHTAWPRASHRVTVVSTLRQPPWHARSRRVAAPVTVHDAPAVDGCRRSRRIMARQGSMLGTSVDCGWHSMRRFTSLHATCTATPPAALRAMICHHGTPRRGSRDATAWLSKRHGPITMRHTLATERHRGAARCAMARIAERHDPAGQAPLEAGLLAATGAHRRPCRPRRARLLACWSVRDAGAMGLHASLLDHTSFASGNRRTMVSDTPPTRFVTSLIGTNPSRRYRRRAGLSCRTLREIAG